MNYKDKINNCIEKVEKGVQDLVNSEKWIEYLDTLSKFHNYSFSNIMLIKEQCPTASFIAGFKKWNQLGRHVKKGEKALKILAPYIKKYTKIENDETKEERKLSGYFTVNVFDISQTEGKEIINICKQLKQDSESAKQLYNKLLDIFNVKIEEVDSIKCSPQANGVYFKDINVIKIRKQSTNQMVKTLIHELSHYRIDIENISLDQFDNSKGIEECIVESVAYTVCDYYGIDTSNYSFGYIAGWSNANIEDIKAIATYVRNISNNILENLEKKDV